MEQELQQLQTKIKQRIKGTAWQPELRAKLLELAEILYQEHRNWRLVSQKLGVSYQYLYKLRRSHIILNPDKSTSFAIVTLEKEEEKEAAEITVSSPNGFQMKGLSFLEAIKAMEVLSCSK
jgi:DNA gyrase/topoisomerase IV subunit A